jgi:hypothetical protein
MISWTDYVKNEEVLQRVKEERNTLHTTKGRKANCTSHTLVGNGFQNMLLEESQKGMKMRRKT